MYLVYDIGGSAVKHAVMTADGEIIKKGNFPTIMDPDYGIDNFIDDLAKVYNELKSEFTFKGIALSMPGQVDVEKGIVYIGGSIRYLHEARLAERLSALCDGIRVSMENDGKCAALAEVWKGNAVDADNACVVICGTGIGGGIIKDKHIHRGNHLIAGEISYWIDDMQREDLYSLTELDSYSNVDNVYEYFPYMYTSKASTRSLVYHVATRKGISTSEVNGELIYKWAEEGDEIAKDCLENMYFAIAKLCCNLQAAFDPDVILLGGGISSDPRFLKGVLNYSEQLKLITAVFRPMKIDICKHKNDSNLLGALYNFFEVYGKDI